MFPHHVETIEKVTEHFKNDPQVEALLLTGSISHGFESEGSDVDIAIIISDDDYQARLKTGQVTFFSVELCTYQGGYVDGKYISLELIRKVADMGSDPARFAFDGARILFNRIQGLEDELRRAVAYPAAENEERIQSFRAQLEAWNWYYGEARKKDNQYLLGVAANNLILFGGRLVLAHNKMLYPYHKWFLRVLEAAPEKPAGLMPCIQKLVVGHSAENIEAFYQMIKTYQPWKENPNGWGAQFMLDSELNWIHGRAPIADI